MCICQKVLLIWFISFDSKIVDNTFEKKDDAQKLFMHNWQSSPGGGKVAPVYGICVLGQIMTPRGTSDLSML